MHILENSKSSSAKTEFSFFSVFFSSVFAFFNTDVGVGFVFLNIAISVSVFGYRLGSNTDKIKKRYPRIAETHHYIDTNFSMVNNL